MLPAFVCYGIVCCVTHFIVENFIHLMRVVKRKSQVLIPLLAIHGLLATCVYAHSPLTFTFLTGLSSQSFSPITSMEQRPKGVM